MLTDLLTAGSTHMEETPVVRRKTLPIENTIFRGDYTMKWISGKQWTGLGWASLDVERWYPSATIDPSDNKLIVTCNGRDDEQLYLTY